MRLSPIGGRADVTGRQQRALADGVAGTVGDVTIGRDGRQCRARRRALRGGGLVGRLIFDRVQTNKEAADPKAMLPGGRDRRAAFDRAAKA